MNLHQEVLKQIITDESQELAVMRNFILSNKPGIITRIGGTEWSFVVECYKNNFVISQNNNHITFLKSMSGYYDKNNSSANLKKFLDLMIENYQLSDHVLIANASLLNHFNIAQNPKPHFIPIYDQFINTYLKNKPSISYRNVEDLRKGKEWFTLLEGKKVLVINPFVDDIKKQWEKRKLFFKKDSPFDFIYPDFEIKYLGTPITYNITGSTKENFPHDDWFQTLDHLKEELKLIDFDIALIGCAAYGYPLASEIKKSGRKAIYIGGILQIYFGVLGKRWEEGIKNYLNLEHWIRPSEKPLDFYCKNNDYPKGEVTNAYW